MSTLSMIIDNRRKYTAENPIKFGKKNEIYAQLLAIEANTPGKELPKTFYLLHVDMSKDDLVKLLNSLNLQVKLVNTVCTGHTYGDAYFITLE